MIFFTADQHFDHGQIIRHCKRPFPSVEEMNDCLLEKWNEVVGPFDTVFFLGDLVYGKGSRSITYWLDRLNGKIVFIRGNHDKMSDPVPFLDFAQITYKEHTFKLCHCPQHMELLAGWTICGHKHNNDTKKYPFINGQTRVINVSVELTDYSPVSIEEIIALDYRKVKRKERFVR